MQAAERQKRITDHLLAVEFASLQELSGLVNASVSTVRRDVTVLDGQGTVCRTHGGARLASPKSDEEVFSIRDTHQLREKEAIGRACAELVPANQTIILDAGTTCYHVARYLESKTPQVFTNSLPVANLYSTTNKLEVVVSGGVIYPRLGVLVGPLAVEAFSKIQADVAIMSCGGITTDGITNSHSLLIDMQRAMINAAGRVIFCVDSSKIGRQSISKLCDLDMIDVLVTDSGAPSDFLEMLRRRNIQVIVAPVEPLSPMTPPPVSLPPPSPPPRKPAAMPAVATIPAPKRPSRPPAARKPKRPRGKATPPKAEPPEATEDMPVHFL